MEVSALSSPDFTTLLMAWRNGDNHAAEQIAELVYAELRQRAKSYLAGEHGYQTLSATALVNETFVRLIGGAQVEWQCRAHFFVVASNAMRRILIDAARHRRVRQNGDHRWVENEEITPSPANFFNRKIDLLALNEALQELALFDPRAAQVVELRYFGGLTEQEIADVLGVSLATVKRDWASAKTWLYGRLKSGSNVSNTA
ncbi:MAG: sigma-70 family RNA polymerase sigma factor [Acidobacteria bacterium]|nr:sigma-70 family RNA polymerase sigma factor [Acidobacteriota bacterium]